MLNSLEDINNCTSIEELVDCANALASDLVAGTNACQTRITELIDSEINKADNEEYYEHGDGEGVLTSYFNHPEL